MIKFVATDIDGTILVPEGQFTKSVKECIKTLNTNGIKVVLVTGRMHQAAQQIADELGLDTPIVSYQGGLIRENNKTLYEQCLTKSQTIKIINWARTENIHINLYNNDVLYTELDNYEIQRYSKRQNVNYIVKSFDNVEKNKVNKILAIDYDNSDRINFYEKELPNIFPELYIVKSTTNFLEFSNPKASKFHAVKYLQNYWNFNDDEILTIGDQNNDIELLKAGGIKIAMGNATKELKSVADYITDTVQNDGFVKAMEKFVQSFDTQLT